MEDEGINYYQPPVEEDAGLRYRLEGGDIVKRVIDTLKGGLYKDKDGKKKYRADCRLMNEEGIARVEFYLNASVHKGAHLTQYKNEERIMTQMKALSGAYLHELALNMKRWGPEKDVKVRNKYLVMQVVENAMLQAMLRGLDAMEAKLTGKSWHVVEQGPQQPMQQAPKQGLFGRWFGRKKEDDNYGQY